MTTDLAATTLTIDAAADRAPFAPFWCSTGFMPASILLDADMRQMMAYFGAVPHGGLRHVRIHYLLDLVRGTGFLGRRPDIDWSLLDQALDTLVENGLQPFFELMGNPGLAWTDFEDPAQVRAWRRLVAALARHLGERYGQEAVRSWYFETWNEPDVGGWWKSTVQGFLNYYDACSAGLADADRRLTFGGPGTASTLSPIFRALMDHVDGGENFFTGRPRTRIDFISVHEKGAVWQAENISPDLRRMCGRELEIVRWLRDHHPRLAKTPFMNNECDPQISWKQTHTWRATAYYAAQGAKGIVQHLRFLRDEHGVNYVLHGNDNGFPGGWGARTCLAALHDRANIRKELVDQIKKPFLTLFEMMALLGDERVRVEGAGGALDDFGALATRRGDDQVAVLVYHSHDRVHTARNRPVTADLTVTGLPFRRGAVTHYRIADGELPFDVWDAAHADHVMKSLALTAELIRKLRERQELPCVSHRPEVGFDGGSASVRIEVVEPSVHLLLFTRKPPRAPGTVRGLRVTRHWGITGQAQVMLRWEGLGSRALRTYEVGFAKSRDGKTRRVNTPDLLPTAFLHEAPDVRGWYRVRAVDYWGRPGPWSAPVEVG